MTPYGGAYLEKVWLGYFFAWWHQLITWNDVGLPSIGFCAIRLKTASIGNAHGIYHYKALENYTFQIKTTFPNGRWIDTHTILCPLPHTRYSYLLYWTPSKRNYCGCICSWTALYVSKGDRWNNYLCDQKKAGHRNTIWTSISPTTNTETCFSILGLFLPWVHLIY